MIKLKTNRVNRRDMIERGVVQVNILT